MAARRPDPSDVAGGVARILGDERVLWLPIKHYSPACAFHVRQALEAERPAAVLVEGPDDATPLIEHIVDPSTEPPLTVFSVYTDAKNRFGQNGILSPAPHLPARFRSWWPLTAYAPEYVALITGADLDAELQFIDLPLTNRIPFEHARQARSTEVVDDGRLARSAYFQALGHKDRRRSFLEFWDGRFEAPAFQMSTEAFFRQVLTFAWCARYAGDDPEGLAADGTTLREAQMRWHVEAALNAHPGRRIAVVTGAFHTVALPWARAKRSRGRKSDPLETLVTAHSFAALARLYHMERMPAFNQAVWEAIEDGEAAPLDAAAMGLLVEIMRRGREEKLPLSTADAVGGWQAARHLAELRGNRQVTVFDLLDAAQLGFVKGDRRVMGAGLTEVARRVLVGQRHGRITSAAGQLPLRTDFYAECKRFRLDLSGDAKTVRLDLHKQVKHRHKSAFLHRCDFLDVPMFSDLETGWNRERSHFRGPDPARRTDMHLIGERWGVRWKEDVDDRLVELAAQGTSIVEAAGTELRMEIARVQDDAAAAAKLLVRAAQMLLTHQLDAVLDALEAAMEVDASFVHLVDALDDATMLYGFRETLAVKGHLRLGATAQHLYHRAAAALPGIAGLQQARQRGALQRLATLVRLALGSETLRFDRAFLIEQLGLLAHDPNARAPMRGAAYGVLYAFGAESEAAITTELIGYLRGTSQRRLEAGGFLDGLFSHARGLLLESAGLRAAVTQVLAELPWEDFKLLLPDLRRAFTQFIPAEIESLAGRVSRSLGLEPPPDRAAPIPDAVRRVGAAADARVAAVLDDWGL